MADFEITISNTLKVYGQAPTSLWGAMIWGTDKWGTNDDSFFDIGKLISETLSISEEWQRNVFEKLITNTLTLSSDVPSVKLGTADSEWFRVFPSDTTNGAAQVIDNFTKISDASTGFSQVSDPSDTWSKV